MPLAPTWIVTLAILGTFAVTTIVPRALPQRPEAAAGFPPAETQLFSSSLPVCQYGVQEYYFVAGDASTPFNATPEAWDLRAFDSRCQPKPLVEQLLDAQAGARRQISIMLYGDRC